MLRITNTDNLMGIVIHGDYDDLDALRDALGRCNEFCYEEKKRFYEETSQGKSDQQYEARMYQEYEYFLSLNYDIRHAFQGDRNYELAENNSRCLDDHKSFFDEEDKPYRNYEKLYEITQHGNLQYSVEFLYPLALYYMYAVYDMIDLLCEDSFLDNLTVDYTQKFIGYPEKPYTLYQDIGILLQFYGLLQKALAEAIGENKVSHLLAYMSESIHSNTNTLYTDALLHYYCKSGPESTGPVKKALIILMAYELFDGGMLIGRRGYGFATKDCNAAKKLITSHSAIPFPEADVFFRKLKDFTDKLDGPFYQSAFDQFLENEYGEVDDEQDFFGTDVWPEILK